MHDQRGRHRGNENLPGLIRVWSMLLLYVAILICCIVVCASVKGCCPEPIDKAIFSTPVLVKNVIIFDTAPNVNIFFLLSKSFDVFCRQCLFCSNEIAKVAIWADNGLARASRIFAKRHRHRDRDAAQVNVVVNSHLQSGAFAGITKYDQSRNWLPFPKLSEIDTFNRNPSTSVIDLLGLQCSGLLLNRDQLKIHNNQSPQRDQCKDALDNIREPKPTRRQLGFILIGRGAVIFVVGFLLAKSTFLLEGRRFLRMISGVLFMLTGGIMMYHGVEFSGGIY